MRQGREETNSQRSDWPESDRSKSAECEAGYVLISVLLSAALLALLLNYVLSTTRHQIGMTASHIGSMQAQFMARSAILLTAIQHTNISPVASTRGRSNGNSVESVQNGQEVSCLLDGFEGYVILSIQDHGGLVDLNFAPPSLIMAGLLATGVPENTAKSAASRLVANRGKSTSTSNKTGHNLFLSANEVSNYLPFDPLRAGKYQSIFTVHGRNTGLDPRVAPPGLLQMLPIALNAYGLSGDIGTILPNGIRFPTHLYRPTKSDTATIQSEAISDNSSSRAIQQWIILMKPSDEYPFTLLEQNYGLSLERTADQNFENLPLC